MTTAVQRATAAIDAEPDTSDGPAPVPYLRPVPDSLPPFDDERTARTRLRALAVASPAGRAIVRAMMRPPSTRVEVADASVPSWSREPDVGVRPTRTQALPEADRVGRSLARALAEVISGRRPLGQLRALCAPEVFAGLAARPLSVLAVAQLTSVRVSEPADGVAEVTAIIRTGRRAHALAFRIQGLDGRWRITALQTA